MGKKMISAPSKQNPRVKVRVLCDIPIFQEYQPVVGQIYDAEVGSTIRSCDFCLIEVGGKRIWLRNKSGFDNEYEVVTDGC